MQSAKLSPSCRHTRKTVLVPYLLSYRTIGWLWSSHAAALFERA
jgi:hypothetical protein